MSVVFINIKKKVVCIHERYGTLGLQSFTMSLKQLDYMHSVSISESQLAEFSQKFEVDGSNNLG